MHLLKNIALVTLAIAGLSAFAACEPAQAGADAPSAPAKKSTPAPASPPATTTPNEPAPTGPSAPVEVVVDLPAPTPMLIPATILPAGCSLDNEEAGPWDGHEQFTLECPAPSTKGWTKVATVDNYGAGSANRSHAYRKDGWMMLFGERCCSACVADKLTECVPWFSTRLYPPADLKDCAHSKLCDQVGLCVQKDGWCEGADEDWGLSM